MVPAAMPTHGIPCWTTVSQSAASPFPGGIQHVDCAVIGAGLGGLSAALHLLAGAPGRRVMVLEAQGIGGGASLRTTGMVTPGVGQSLPAMVRRFGREAAGALYAASLDAIRYVETLSRRQGIDGGFRQCGQLVLAHGRQGRARLALLADMLDGYGFPCQRLDDGALRRHLDLGGPAPGGDGTAGPAALRLPVAGTLDPGRFLNGLAGRIRDLGGMIHTQARVLGLSTGRPVRLTLADGVVVAESVIIALSGFSAGAGILRGRMLPVHLQALATEPLSASDLSALGWSGRECVIDSRRLFNYFRLSEDNRIIFGGGAPRYHWNGTEPAGAAAAMAGPLARALHDTVGRRIRPRIAGTWTGTIAYTLDALPVIGRLPSHPGVLFAGGWCGHGVALSVSAGAWLAHMVDHGEPPAALPWFRDRSPLVPFEPARWGAFRASVAAMRAMDRLQ